MIKKKYSNIRKNTYIMQIITLMSGTLIAQVVMLGFMPLLTRLYTPSEFGLFSLFFSITGILGAISSWKYDQAIMLPKSNKDAEALVFLSVLITLGMTTFVSILIIVFFDLIVDYFNGSIFLVWLLPVSMLLIGLMQIFTAFASRKQLYKGIATVRVANALSTVGIQGGARFFLKLDGLVIGKVIADFVSVVLLIKYYLNEQTIQLKFISKRRITVNTKRHEHFPKYQTFTVFLNAISQNIPILLLASLYSAEVAGFYALTVRILQVPVSLIGGSTREVYYQRASKLYALGESILSLYTKTTLGLLKLFVIPFLTILFFGEYLFSFIFGAVWTDSGTMAQILVLWFLFLFINSPSIMTYSILKLQKVQMKLEIVSVFLRFFSIYAGFVFFNSYIVSISFFLISSVCINIFAIVFIYLKLKEEII